MDAGEGGQKTATAAVPVEELKMWNLSKTRPQDCRAEKEEVLQRVRPAGVRTLVDVRCDEDPDWAMELLRCAKPALEWLQLYFPQPRHLQEVFSMRKLHTLHVFCYKDLLEAPTPLVPVDQPSSLQILWVCDHGLPLETFKSLLKQHGATLQEVRLRVETPLGKMQKCYHDLHLLVEPLTALSILVLERPLFGLYTSESCKAQLSKVQKKLPSGNIVCDCCKESRLQVRQCMEPLLWPRIFRDIELIVPNVGVLRHPSRSSD